MSSDDAPALRIPCTEDVFLNAQIVAYIAYGGDETATPDRAALMCSDTSDAFQEYLGANATIVRAQPEWWGYDEHTGDPNFAHDICCLETSTGVYAIDFTAAQYGLCDTFPLILHAHDLPALVADECQPWLSSDEESEGRPAIMTPADQASRPAWRRLRA